MQARGSNTTAIDPHEISRRTRRYTFELLSGKGSLDRTLQGLRTEPWEIQRQVFSAILPTENVRLATVGIPFPQSFRELDPVGRVRQRESLQHELSWSFAILRYYAAELRQQLAKAREVDLSLLKAEWDNADDILEKAQENWGASLWYVATKLFLAERIEGAAARNRIVQAIIDQSPSPYVKAFAFLYSLRAERQMTQSLFEEELRAQFRIDALAQEAPPIAFHLRFRSSFTSISEVSDELLASNLVYDEGYSLIDRYYTFVRTLQLILGKKTSAPPAHWLGRIARRASETFDDARLRAATRMLSGQLVESQPALATEVARVVEAYTKGNYHLTAELAATGLAAHPDVFEFHELWVLALSRLGERPSRPALLVDMHLLEYRSTEASSAELDLTKIINEFDWIPFLGSLDAFVRIRSVRPQPLDPIKWQALNATTITPRAALAFDDPELAERYLDALDATFPSDVAVELFRSVVKSAPPPSTAPEDRRMKYAALTAERQKNYDRATDLYRRLRALAAGNRPLTQTALEGEYRCQLQLTNLEACLEIAANELIDNDVAFFKAKVTELIGRISISGDRALRGHPAWPILHFKQVRSALTGRDGHSVFSALEEFLAIHSLRRPSELGNIFQEFSLAQLIFLLKHICVPDILDWSLEFQSSEALDLERVAILGLLERIDPEGAKSYQEERTRLTRRAVVQRGLREVDRGKIYIDTAGIRQSLGAPFFERVGRYITVRSMGEVLTFLGEFRLDKGIFIISKGPGGRLVADDGLRLFAGLHNEIKNRFLSSDEYGLDTSLSVEIRHGTLSGQIRGPFERAHLITRRDAADGQYAPNNYWLERSSDATDPNLEALDALLTDFSARIDAKIDEVKDRWIQLRDAEKNPEGLFAYEYDGTEIKQARDKADAAADSQELVDAIFDDLWLRTRNNLSAVKHEIKTTLATALYEFLTELETNVQYILPEIATDLRQHVASCRTELDTELEVIAGWFAVDEASAMSDFEIGVVLDTVLEQVRRVPGGDNFEPKRTINAESTFQGRTFRSLAKVLYLVLENVVKHGGDKTEGAEIGIVVKKTELVITVSNPIPDFVDVLELLAATRSLEANARGEGERRYVRQEGGSGYHKLGKLLRHDLGRVAHLVSVRVKDQRFTVTIQMELEGLVI